MIFIVLVTIAQAVMTGLILMNQPKNILLLLWSVGFLLFDIHLIVKAL